MIIQIVGERRSGTNYAAYLIKTNFLNMHLCQFLFKDEKQIFHKHEFLKFDRLVGKDLSQYLFIFVHRNPYDWVCSMKNKRFGYSPHLEKLSFSEFLRAEWVETAGYKDINPLTNKILSNIIDLRNSKNMIYSLLKNHVKNYVSISYDELYKNQSLLLKVAQQYDIKTIKNQIINETLYVNPGKLTINKNRAVIKTHTLIPDDVKFINENLNWPLENELGYTMRQI